MIYLAAYLAFFFNNAVVIQNMICCTIKECSMAVQTFVFKMRRFKLKWL